LSAYVTYLDTSALVKRYILERGSDEVAALYSRAWGGDVKLSFSLWNVGEALGVFDKYHSRGWIATDSYRLVRECFLNEVARMLKLGVLRLVPLRASIIVEAWRLVEEHHIYEADALQVVSAKYVKADEFYTADEELCDVAATEGFKTKRLT
jgi:predicted nucleic acid-binding protein